MARLQSLTTSEFIQTRRHIRLIATDMDGTLTQAGQLTPGLLQALIELQAAGLAVLIVTGRSVGWVQGLVSYLPVAGAIAENGGLYMAKPDLQLQPLVDLRDITAHRQQLAQLFAQLQGQYPQLRESSDNRFRLSDWTFDVAGLSPDTLTSLQATCAHQGWGFTYSTVQCHLKLPHQDKAPGLQTVLRRYFPDLSPEQVLTVGDSPNDQSLFDTAYFPYSVGVANVAHYCDGRRLAPGGHPMTHLPTYLTTAAEAAGFCELVQQLLAQAHHP
ncbi:Mannosyl-3-phosphoglycerate phosphatase [Halomicronema hongdechloris C2206]|uniref:Mannosyl-3-phosphoglycerate phosphatase n=1 Tax=Halomicronema hongdechloris C2206 TaxID=1641165 RepID=A0A1Z3HNK4_9CYAN|nr:HAD family hydrolase [Halomicronema hongdechloris]ASC71856.1 Mannosyl-3-phosphoglycerate phosphatase [Halomicronema hongdechloris C2206]